MGLLRFLYRVVQHVARRYPKVGKWIATGFGALETPLLDLIHFIDARVRPGTKEQVMYYFTRVYGSRVVPLDVNLEGRHVISPTEEMKNIIRRVPALSIGWCYCRRKHQRCDTSIWTCIHIGTAKYLGDLAKKMPLKSASVTEVEELLDWAEEKGLVHQLITAPTSDYTYVICNCCECCCTILQSAAKYQLPGIVAHSNFIARQDPTACTNCGACVERCHFGARQLVDGVLEYNPRVCYGCGLCVHTCPTGAITLERRSAAEHANVLPPDPRIVRE